MRLLKIVPDNTSFRFVRLRWFAFAFTILLTGASIALIASRGLTLGVDFVGGLMIEAGFEQLALAAGGTDKEVADAVREAGRPQPPTVTVPSLAEEGGREVHRRGHLRMLTTD